MDYDNDGLHLYLPSQTKRAGIRQHPKACGILSCAVLHDRMGDCHPRDMVIPAPSSR